MFTPFLLLFFDYNSNVETISNIYIRKGTEAIIETVSSGSTQATIDSISSQATIRPIPPVHTEIVSNPDLINYNAETVLYDLKSLKLIVFIANKFKII